MAEHKNQPSYMRWLPSKTTATIARCELIARGLVEGFISGRHRSPKKGFSVEFAEHRQYVPGDDLKNLDWKVLGRKDRLYIKQYMEETNLRATILLDCSGSMAYCGDEAVEFEGRRLSKFEYAQYLAAGLTYMLVGQQDGVGMVMFDDKVREYLPAKARASQVRNILEYIDTHSGESLEIQDLAEMCHMSYSHFAKLFRENYGRSCKEYITYIRLVKAQDLLLHTDFDINYIALETGFFDCSHFIRTYKKWKGITPKQERMSS